MRLVALVVACGIGAGPVAAAELFHEPFDGCHGGHRNAAQVDTGLALAVGGDLPGWRKSGQGTVHVVDRTGGGDLAAMIWIDNVIELETGIAANERDVVYMVSFDHGPTVYATPAQASASTDGIVVEIVRDDGSLLAAFPQRTVAWSGRQVFARVAFDYAGDGSGPVRLRIRPLARDGRFGGAIDDVRVETVPQTAATRHFDAAVAPVLARRCLECHRGDAAEAGLDLASMAAASAGGESGPAIMPGSAAASLLWQRVAADEMPPAHSLDDHEKRLLRDWLDAGAVWGRRSIDPFAFSSADRAGYDWWAYGPLAAVAPPQPPDPPPGWPQNEIDAFVLAGLRDAGLAPAPRADPRTLVRRLHVDLLGLPPPPELVARFAADPSQAAWETLVDELLASPAHAERNARHWLDVARFGESDGYEYNRPRDAAWPYRDWVIRALEDDMPFDRFVAMQLAGDVIDPEGLDGGAATGFLVAGVHNTILGADPAMREAARQDELEALVGTVGQAFLGLTIQCARCHDHKFDPVSTEEYYRVAAAFGGVTYGTRQLRDPTGSELAVYTAVSTPPPATRVLARGDVARPGIEVTAGGLRAVAGTAAEFGLPVTAGDGERRAALAAWITAPGRGLFQRVIVNRVWQWHVGRGLVETPSDFGFSGGRPSHPALLEWLAARFRDDGLSLRRLERLICTSATYQQAATHDPAAAAIDADNRLLWRMTPRRIEGEVLRDALLAVAGALDPARFGPGFRDVAIVEVPPTSYYVPADPLAAGLQRRTIYRFSPRGQRSPLLDTFDCPDPSTQTPRRGVTTTPTQALALWNDPLVLGMAARMADRVGAEAGPRIADQVERAWWLAYARAPAADERRLAEAHVERHGLAALCRVVVNGSEFVVVD